MDSPCTCSAYSGWAAHPSVPEPRCVVCGGYRSLRDTTAKTTVVIGAAKSVSDKRLLAELEQFAASHSRNGEARTADLLRRAARRMLKLTMRHDYIEE